MTVKLENVLEGNTDVAEPDELTSDLFDIIRADLKAIEETFVTADARMEAKCKAQR